MWGASWRLSLSHSFSLESWFWASGSPIDEATLTVSICPPRHSFLSSSFQGTVLGCHLSTGLLGSPHVRGYLLGEHHLCAACCCPHPSVPCSLLSCSHSRSCFFSFRSKERVSEVLSWGPLSWRTWMLWFEAEMGPREGLEVEAALVGWTSGFLPLPVALHLSCLPPPTRPCWNSASVKL